MVYDIIPALLFSLFPGNLLVTPYGNFFVLKVVPIRVQSFLLDCHCKHIPVSAAGPTGHFWLIFWFVFLLLAAHLKLHSRYLLI